MTHICVGKLIIIGSYNGLSPDRRQAIIWTNARLLSIGPLPTYFNEILIKLQQFSLTKMHVKLSSAKWRPSCLGLNVLKVWTFVLVPVAAVWVNVASSTSGATCQASSEKLRNSETWACDYVIDGLVSMSSRWTPVVSDPNHWIQVSITITS